MMMGGLEMGALLLVPALLASAALMAALPGGVLRTAGGALIGLAFLGFLLGSSPAPMRPMAGPKARIMLKAPADAPQAIEVRPQAPAKAK